MSEKRFDFEEEYITLDGGVFATAKNKHDAELISKTLNQLYSESEELKHQVNYLEDRLDDMIVLKKENQQLRQILDIGETNAKDIVDVLNIQQREIRELEKQREELFIRERNTKNKLRELQERNNRQCQQLDTLYKLIEKQDWETLNGIIQELKEADERLQKEWGTYGDEHLAWKRVDVE